MLPKMSMHQNDGSFLFQLCLWNLRICSDATKTTFQILIPCFNQNCLEKEPFLKVQSPPLLSASQCITHTLGFSWLCMMVLTNCTAPKATGLLSCLQMKIVSFRMKPKWMWHLIEVRLEILGAILSLCWVQPCFCMKNRRASHGLCCNFDNNNSSCLCSVVCSDCNGPKDMAVALFSQRLSTMVRCSSEQASSLLVKDGASGSASPMRWEACLLWEEHLAHGPVSPTWGCSMCSQITGKLGHCKISKPLNWSLQIYFCNQRNAPRKQSAAQPMLQIPFHFEQNSLKFSFWVKSMVFDMIGAPTVSIWPALPGGMTMHVLHWGTTLWSSMTLAEAHCQTHSKKQPGPTSLWLSIETQSKRAAPQNL